MVQKKNTLTKTGIVALLACVCCISDRVADRAEMSEAILFVKDISAF